MRMRVFLTEKELSDAVLAYVAKRGFKPDQYHPTVLFETHPRDNNQGIETTANIEVETTD